MAIAHKGANADACVSVTGQATSGIAAACATVQIRPPIRRICLSQTHIKQQHEVGWFRGLL
eukprot:866830-Amphidinium_carterae.1